MKYLLILMLFIVGCIKTSSEQLIRTQKESIRNFETKLLDKYPNHPGMMNGDIYFEGYYAGQSGFDFTINPYQYSYDRPVWLNGWMDAKNNFKKEK